MGTCALDAALGTRSPTLRLPVKAFRDGRSNRCMLTVHRLRWNAPAMSAPLLLPGKEEHIRVRHRERANPPPTTGGWLLRLRLRLYVAQPRGLSGNRRRAREEGGKHEERGFLWAETGMDTVGEGGCGRQRSRGWCAGRLRVGSSAPRGCLAVTLPASPQASRGSRRVTLSRKFPQLPEAPWTTRGHHRLPPPCRCGRK